jgi:hypothetical protein
VPYWRVALQHDWGRNSAEVGTYGLYADVYPSAMDQGDTNSFTDVGVDAQYQYMSSPHFFSIRGTWIYEKQEWDASYDLGLTANRNSNMDVYKANINYFYQSSCGIFGGSVGYFYSDGDTDVLLYAADPVDGSRNGSPDSNGFIVEADYIFKEKYKLALQYTIYNKFNGSDSNYDGFGRDASDNNTFYALLWLMF